MSAGRPIRTYGTMRGWWVTAVRALSLVLALALVIPGTVHSAEAHRTAHHEFSMTSGAEGAASAHSDACPACHANCGCHQAISPDSAFRTPAREIGRASYETVVRTVASVSPDRLPRPPRA